MLIIKVGLIVVMIIRMVHRNYSAYQSRTQPNIFIGKHNIIEQRNIKDTIELDSISDYKKWKSVSSSSNYLSVEHSDVEIAWYEIEVDKATHYIGLIRHGEDMYQKLTYTTYETEIIILNGKFYSDSTSVKLKKLDQEYLLRSREISLGARVSI